MLKKDPRLEMDLESAADEIAEFMRDQLRRSTRNRGFVIGLSGGVDSATTAALATRAVGPRRVLGLLLPERHSDPESEGLARRTAQQLGISILHIDLSDHLDSLHVYEDQEEVVRSLDPHFDSRCRFRLVLPGDLRTSESLNVYTLEVHAPNGEIRRTRVDAPSLRRLQALTNVKLRLRMVMLYREAESRGALVLGTTNCCETDQGFFVQHGDGAVDLEPIAHLYKTQVRNMARHLGLPPEIAERPASPDTWSAPVGDDEFYFRLPYEVVDSVLIREQLGMSDAEIATELGLETAVATRIRKELRRRRRLSAALRTTPPSLAEPKTLAGASR